MEGTPWRCRGRPGRRWCPVTATVPDLWECHAVIFDTDGVITDSASVHAEAWKEAFDEVPGVDPPFDADEDYRRHVDGKSRLDGAAAFLAARGIELPVGDVEDAPGTETVCQVAARKEEAFMRRLHERGVDVFAGTVRLLNKLHEAGVPCAAVSSSRHARDLLARAGVRSLLGTVVDGNDMARLALPGKPDPALFLEGVRRLGCDPATAAVVEDALAGVEAGHRGGFGLVVGVNRTETEDGAHDLSEHGADLVVDDLARLVRR
ncbi:HAD-IA family hydrolase [Streptomyces sedi]|uniref:HAD-IA family hydrolase n=1 Tax=Streptomyces sedi TaxID=555059 RepID=A0A5C4VBL7_9ACTN|nr:HAD-IA family hydrolase [Streptomyces sedi]